MPYEKNLLHVLKLVHYLYNVKYIKKNPYKVNINYDHYKNYHLLNISM
jgi:hypothetical protein